MTSLISAFAPTGSASRWLGLWLIGAMTGLAVFGPVAITTDPTAQDLMQALAPPSLTHPLGADHLGRDVLARVAHGAVRSLGLAVICVAVASAVGITLGLVAAYRRSWLDAVVMRLADLTLALPGMLLALLLAGFLGGGILPMLIGIELTLWPQFARLSRAVALGVLREPHVEAAELAGFGRIAILRRHVLPSVLRQTMSVTTLSVGSAILSISALGFLGLGLQPPTPEWGAMISEMLPYLDEAPVQIAAPCGAIFLSVLGLTLLGQSISNPAARTQTQ
jgi:ABC-type dipeptide/oligopeptide/nickel transport system permease subunit